VTRLRVRWSPRTTTCWVLHCLDCGRKCGSVERMPGGSWEWRVHAGIVWVTGRGDRASRVMPIAVRALRRLIAERRRKPPA
jgi:hypothetical protein